MAYEVVLFEYGTRKEGYQRSESTIGENPLVAGTTYEISFSAGISQLPAGWILNALHTMRLKPYDSPLYGVITEKCNITYARVDELRDDTGATILARTVTAQFEYLGSPNQSGLVKNVVRRLQEWGDIYTLEMVPPENMVMMAIDTVELPLGTMVIGAGAIGAVALFFMS